MYACLFNTEISTHTQIFAYKFKNISLNNNHDTSMNICCVCMDGYVWICNCIRFWKIAKKKKKKITTTTKNRKKCKAYESMHILSWKKNIFF